MAAARKKNADPPVIAIDGPSGSGKGTAAAALAEHLGFHLLDSGALYRAMGLAALRAGLDLDGSPRDPKYNSAVANLVTGMEIRFNPVRIYLSGENVSEAIRSEEAGEAASKLATVAVARMSLLQFQRVFREPPGLVADGRDMGSQVFPDAVLKVFLTANPEERARRRYQQLLKQGIDVNLETLQQDLKRRDARDRRRIISPVRPLPSSVVIDSSEMQPAQVLAQLKHLAEQRLQEAEES